MEKNNAIVEPIKFKTVNGKATYYLRIKNEKGEFWTMNVGKTTVESISKLLNIKNETDEKGSNAKA